MRISLRSALIVLALPISFLCMPSPAAAQALAPKAAPPAPTPRPGPQSTHYPILLLASGADPVWSVRIGSKGPERLERAAYPPIILEPADISRDGSTDAWTYNAKDSGTGATVAVMLTRMACTDGSDAKFTFRAEVHHAQIGVLKGCARIAAELFPRAVGQTAQDDDPDAKKPVVIPVTKFKSPVSVAYINALGKVVVSRGELKKIAAPAGSELSLSHDGKRLLYTRSDSKTGPERTVMLWDDAGHSKELAHGLVRQAFWSPDDARVALLKFADEKWHVFVGSANALEGATLLSATPVNALHGWLDGHTVLASDAQNLYWISDDKPLQTVPLKEIYGEAFQVMSSDALRLNPENPDLLLVSAAFSAAPAGSPTDSMDMAAGFFLYELRSKRRVVLSPADQWARGGEWSRDGVQIFYTRRVSQSAFTTNRVFWDGSGLHRFQDGYDLVVGQ